MSREDITTWLEEGLDKSGLSMAKASRQLGLPKDAISKVLRHERELTAAELVKLGTLLGIAPPRVLVESMQPALYITVIGGAQAGLWWDVSQADFVQYDIPCFVDPSLDRAGIFGLVVKGESINIKARDGDHVAALRLDKAPRDIMAGDWVVVDRRKNSLCERTIRVLKAGVDGRLEAWPHSTDSRYQEPVSLGVNGSETIEVVAFVINFVSSGTKF